MLRRQFLYSSVALLGGINLCNSAIFSKKRSKVCGVHTVKRSSTSPPKWGYNHLTYYMAGRDTGDMKKAEWDHQWRLAFGSWSKVSPLTFDRTNNSKTADILIDVSRDKDEGFGRRLDILAWAELPSISDWQWQLVTKFDKSEEWVTEIENEKRDILLQNVAAHEIGHLLGLDHSTYEYALMFPYYDPAINIPQPIDDILRIQTLYGEPNANYK